MSEHVTEVRKVTAPSGHAWFTPYCSCGWQGFIQKQLGEPGGVTFISSYDNAWLTAGAQAEHHKKEAAA